MLGSTASRPRKPTRIFFDGGARPNPGLVEVAVVARGQVHFFDELGEGSSSDAEWIALLRALELAQALGLPVFDLIGDSRNIIDQATGAAPCRTPSARAYLSRYQECAASGAPRRLRWIARSQNLAGIALDARRR